MTAPAGPLVAIGPPRRIERTVIALTVNGATHRLAVRPYDVLLDVLRERIGLTGTRRGCDMGTCGCCTVLLDGRPVLSCLTLALQADGAGVRTIEGVAHPDDPARLHPLQEAFLETGGSQCGFCTPGFILSAVGLLERNPDPTEDEVRDAIAGNLCRCTGYLPIVEAVRLAARRLREERVRPSVEAPAPTVAGGGP